MKRVRRILHASDFSSASGRAFVRAVELAKTSRAELLLAHVVTMVAPMMGDAYMPPQTLEAVERSARVGSQRRLDTLAAAARKAGVRARTVLLEGVPANEIVRAAKSRRADMIVVGTHGRSGLARFFLGSVATRVVATAPCPVLTVRGREK